MNSLEMKARGMYGSDRNVYVNNPNPNTGLTTAQEISRGLMTNGDRTYIAPSVYQYEQKNDTPSTGGGTKTNNNTSTPISQNTGGGGGGGGYSGGGGGGGGGMDYAAMIAEMLAKQRAAAEEAYQRAKGNLENAWSNTQNSLKTNLDSALNQMGENYKFGEKTSNDDAEKSLRESYINYMMNKKNLNQNLSALGYSGGATESSLANMFNNYGNARNNIQMGLAENLSKLLNTYNNNVTSANQTYNTTFADAMNNYTNNLNQLEQMLASNVMAMYSGSSLSSLANYAATLANLSGNVKGAAEGYTPTSNSLAQNLVNLAQGGSEGGTNYAKYIAMANSLNKSGNKSNSIITQLADNGASLDAVYAALGI